MHDVQSGGLPGPVVSQEGCDLALVEGDAQSVHGRLGAAAEHLDQVPDTHPLHQALRRRLEPRLVWGSHRSPEVSRGHQQKSVGMIYFMR